MLPQFHKLWEACVRRRFLMLAAAASLAFGLVPLARAASVVNVIQEDPSAGHGIKHMRLVVHPLRVRAGQVTFRIKNISKDLTHEVLVLKPPAKPAVMPYSKKKHRLIESRIDKLGDSGDQKPGQSYLMTVTLKPGRYLLVCNEPGHYMAGMHVWLTVTK